MIQENPASPLVDSESSASAERGKRFADEYARMREDELERLQGDIATLRPEAREALSLELARRNIQPQRMVADDPKPKDVGVGGWLSFLILSLTIFSPLSTAANLFKEWSGVSEGSLLMGIVLADTVISLLVTALGVYAGVCLLRVTPNAVRMAKRFLIVIFIYSVGVLVLTILALRTSSPDAVTSAIGGPTRTVIFVIIWFAYLEYSKRVKATYPPESLGPSLKPD